MKLTDAYIRSIKVGDKPKKHFDGGGLYLHVYPTGGKLWQMAYRFEGKEKTLSFGAYPIVSLKNARDYAVDAKRLLNSGVDPSAYKKAVKAAVHAETNNTFEIIAREWHEKNKSGWSKSHETKTIALLVNHVFPFLGNRPINAIITTELLEVLRKIEARGFNETAHRTSQICGQVFRYAIATGRAENDPSGNLRGALTPVVSNNFATITDTKEIGRLLRDIDNYPGSIVVKAALQILPYVFLRSVELRGGEWSEVDFDKKEWRIPANRMKMKEKHIVPLSNQVIVLLKELNPYTRHSKYIFPSAWSNTKTISDVALLNAVRRMGYEKGKMTIHGFRSMASTLLNERGYNRDWIERQLAHGERNNIRAAYNHAEYLSERSRMMQEWADYLDGLRRESY